MNTQAKLTRIRYSILETILKFFNDERIEALKIDKIVELTADLNLEVIMRKEVVMIDFKDYVAIRNFFGYDKNIPSEIVEILNKDKKLYSLFVEAKSAFKLTQRIRE